MEVTLTDDQEFFHDTTRKFLESECPIVKVRELAASADGFEADYWRQGVELGWTSLLVPEELGGGSISGSGVVDLTLVADSFGAHVAPGPLVPANVVAAALARSGSDEQKAGVLPALVSGEVVATWAVGEPAPHDTLGDVTVTATADGGDYVLSGVKSPVEAGAQSEQLLVTATTDDGLAQFLVPAETSGVTVTSLDSIDLVRRYASIEFDGVRVPVSAAVGSPGNAAVDVERQLQLAIVMQTAEMVGAAETVFDFTLDWMFSRYSFGRPLASYQNLKHRFADMKMWLEASHGLAAATAREVQAEIPEAQETVSAAKAYIGDYLAELVQDCVQMHGGIGLTYDHDIHLFLRRVTVDRLTHGTPADHRQRIAALRVGGRVTAREKIEKVARMTDTEMESVESFRLRVREWLADNMEKGGGGLLALRAAQSDEDELAGIAHARELQRRYYDAGFAGICFPKEYGGQGLSPAHQRAFNQEVTGYDFPSILQVPTFVPCAAVLLEFGTEEQKQTHLPAMLKGEEIWMQFLSEPSGGSDVAGALTTAVRDGDEWVVNGSKIWTTGAWFSDYGLCLLRTNWDVPKHRGLSVFIIKIHQPGIEMHRIEMINGSREFCQEFMTDVRVPDSDRVGEVDDGWTVGTRWMFHERNAMGGGSPYVSGPQFRFGARSNRDPMVELARSTGRLDDPRARDLIGESRALSRAGAELSRRIAEGMGAGVFPDTTAAIARLMSSVVAVRNNTISLELAGPGAVATGGDPGGGAGMHFLMRQTACIGGGTTEMARNNVSERVLGMPREMTHDRNLPFRDVPKGPPGN